MMIMAQHPQQQHHQLQHQQNTTRQKQQHQVTTNAAQFQHQVKTTSAPSNANGLLQQQQQLHHQQEQDGKRTLIKNQLYIIEQLQLENANLRNERDQLQLENEELKFQLQMISSSNILSQPNSTFNNQQLERLVETTSSSGKINGTNHNHHNIVSNTSPTNNHSRPLVGISAAISNQTPTNNTQSNLQQPQTPQQVRLLVTPLKQQQQQQSMKYNNVCDQNQQQVSSATNEQQAALVRLSTIDGKRQQSIDTAAAAAATIIPLGSSSSTTPHRTNKFSSGAKSATQAELNAVQHSRSASTKPQSRDLPQDDEEQRVKLVEQRYGGDSDKVQAAAIIIQRAFRKYQICKRFRTITEQLRHTHQSSSSSSSSAQPVAIERKQRDQKPVQHQNSTTKTKATASVNSNKTSEIPYASGATRAAAWESLSYAANRLAAAAATRQQQQQNTTSSQLQLANKQQPAVSAQAPSQQQQQQVGSITGAVNQHRHSNDVRLTGNQKQDPVVAAAINFQQLESIRKRQYRVGLNIFNKNPEKGISFLVAHSFIDSSSPYLKNSTSYYHSNQLHFIDKQHLLQQQQQQQQQQVSSTSPTNILQQSCNLCCEEENLKRNVAHFLLHRKGLAKEKIGLYLGNLQSQFNQDVLKYYLQELDFYGLQIDLALRKFLSTFRLPGEAQKIERLVDRFAQRYVQCQLQPQQHQQLTGNTSSTNVAQIHLVNQQSLQQQQHHHHHHHQQQQQQTTQQLQVNNNNNNNQQQQQTLNYKNNLILLSKDEIFILTFAIIMLNTDLHSPSLKPTSRMSAMQFVNNLRGVFKSQTINESDLIEIYERVKANQITTTPDHVTHVMKVQQGLTVTNFQRKELPNLCVPHRRLVCFCRLFEVYDINKKERLGQHQREIFLFNDLLLVTKLARRVRANTTQLYTYRQSISLQGLYVQLFQSAHYNFGIRLCQRSNDETIIMFNARNELDQSRFVDDLGESIAEMDEMETIKTHNIIETIHFKYLERMRRHAMMHNINNEQPSQQQQPNNNHAMEDNQATTTNKMLSNQIIENNCDIRTTSVNCKQTSPSIDSRRQRKQRGLDEQEEEQAYEQQIVEPMTPAAVAPTTSALAHGGRVQAKFSSMLNLSSMTDGKGDLSSNDNNNKQQNQTKGLRQNQSFAQQTNGRLVDQSGGSGGAGSRSGNIGGRSSDNQSATGAQRRCSTSSVHSLDSGLFLSRDVSPNQSS